MTIKEILILQEAALKTVKRSLYGYLESLKSDVEVEMVKIEKK